MSRLYQVKGGTFYETRCTFSGALAPDGILPRAKFTLRPSLTFSYIGRVTHGTAAAGSAKLCGVVQGMELWNFCRGRHLHSAGRPSRWSSAHILVTGSIARSATCRHLICSDANFEVFRPAGATRCTDWGEIWHGGGPPCQISPQLVQRLGYRCPKTEIFTEI